jgi:hypothetical protein
MSNLNSPSWLTFRPATIIGRTRTFVALPAFDEVVVNYTGANELVRQYNFSASKNFYLLNRPTKPSNVNFVLCIKYRVGNDVFRYKLWNDGDPGAWTKFRFILIKL